MSLEVLSIIEQISREKAIDKEILVDALKSALEVAARKKLPHIKELHSRFNEETGDWRFTMVMPDGSIYGETNGIRHEQVQFCADCHQDVSKKQDWLFFLPKKYRLLAENSSAASE